MKSCPQMFPVLLPAGLEPGIGLALVLGSDVGLIWLLRDYIFKVSLHCTGLR